MQVHYVQQVLYVQSASDFEFFLVERSLFATNNLKSKTTASTIIGYVAFFFSLNVESLI